VGTWVVPTSGDGVLAVVTDAASPGSAGPWSTQYARMRTTPGDTPKYEDSGLEVNLNLNTGDRIKFDTMVYQEWGLHAWSYAWYMRLMDGASKASWVIWRQTGITTPNGYFEGTTSTVLAGDDLLNAIEGFNTWMQWTIEYTVGDPTGTFTMDCPYVGRHGVGTFNVSSNRTPGASRFQFWTDATVAACCR